MTKAMTHFSLSLILIGTFVLSIPAHAAEPSIEDLLKKESSTSTSIPTIAMPQITQTAPQIPKVEQLKAALSEKITTPGDDQPGALFKELKDKEQKEKESKDKESKDPKDLKEKEVSQSPIEKLITSDETLEAAKVMGVNPAKNLTQFGYSYFKNTSFAPMTDVPVSPDYLTGPGDNLVLNLWGSIEGNYEMTVNRSGEVVLPKSGPVKVAGVPFGKLQEVFRLKLAREFRDFNLSVGMGKLSTIKVYVVGEVTSPGDYSISSLSTLLNALGAAGGPTKNGSLRNIKLRHSGRPEESVDLYDFFTRGDKSRDLRLSSGDTIFVPVLGRVAAIAGNVRRPAIYELKEEKTLKDLLALAEGVTAVGSLQRVQISRVVTNEKKKVLDLDLDSAATGKSIDALAAACPIQDLDIVRVLPISPLLRDHFRLEGHLERPGFYALRPGLRLSGVLNRDQFLPEYYPEFLEVTRLVPPELKPQKIVVDLKGVFAQDPASDLEIKEFDTIRIFSRVELERQPKVKVMGEVEKPGEFVITTQMRVRDLLIQAGYPTRMAYLPSAEINRLQMIDGKMAAFPLTVDLNAVLKGDTQANILLEPFDELVVRKIPNWAEQSERYILLSGEFRFPGMYPIYKGEKLSSVITRAGGFTERAFLPGAKFTRDSLQKLQQKRMDEALAKSEQEVVKKQSQLASIASSKDEIEATKSALAGLKENIELLKNKRAEGRLLVQIKPVEEMKRTHSDIEVKGGDTLIVPSDPDAVNVIGQVYNPTSVVFENERTAGFYLDKVGGPSGEADEDEIYLVKMDGTVFSKRQSSLFHKFSSRSVDSGDTIVVPQRFEKTAWMRDLKDIATIIGQIALTAGVMIAAGL